jgi:TolA-binding protein
MPDLSGVTGAMSTAFDAVKEKTHSAFAAVKGKVGNLMPKQPHWRDQLRQLQEQVANMDEHVKAIPTIQKLENRVKELEGQLQKEEIIQTAVQGLSDMATLQSMQASSLQAPPAKAQAPPLSFAPPPFPNQFGPQTGVRPASNSTSSTIPSRRGGRRTQRNTLRNRRIRASTRSLRQRARE